MKFYCGNKVTWQKEVRLLVAGQLPQGWVWVKSSVNTKVAYRKATPAVYYKQFVPRSAFEGIKSFVRGSRCQRAIKQQKTLTELGFNTPDILCAGKVKSHEFMVSEAFDGIGFGDYLASFFRKTTGRKLRIKRQLLYKVGELVGKLHSLGVVHGDLRPNNILVCFDEGQFNFSLIDNERNKIYKKIPRKKIHKNLVQITMFASEDMTKTDRLRLWSAWQDIYPRFSVNKGRAFRADGTMLMREVFTRVRERLKNKTTDELVSSATDRKYDPFFGQNQ